MSEISRLKIYCDRERIQFPEFTFVYSQITQKFVCIASLKGHAVQTEASKKKDAKRYAARQLCNKLGIGDGSSSPSDDMEYISLLNMHCQKYGFPLPVFAVVNEQGPPHNKLFTMECRLRNYKTTAVAKSLKAAKMLCSKDMLTMVQQNNDDFLLKYIEVGLLIDDLSISTSEK